MDLTHLARELLDDLPAHRTLGLTVVSAADGVGTVQLPVAPAVTNVIGALHSSGITALVDAAALAAVLSAVPDEATGRRLQPLGTRADVAFHRPVRGLALATCTLAPEASTALGALVAGQDQRAVLRTVTRVDGGERQGAAEGAFDWTIRLAPA